MLVVETVDEMSILDLFRDCFVPKMGEFTSPYIPV